MAAYPFLRHIPEHVYPTIPLFFVTFLASAPPILDIPTFYAWRSLNWEGFSSQFPSTEGGTLRPRYLIFWLRQQRDALTTWHNQNSRLNKLSK